MIGLASDLFTSKNEERFWEVEFSIVDVSEDLERLRSIDLTRHDLWATQLLDELLRRQIVATVEESWPGTYTVNLVGIAMWPFINVCTRQLEADGPSDVLMDLVDKVAAFNQAVSDA